MKRETVRRGGFTLVEVIVTLVILGILAAILIPAMTGWIDHSKEKICLRNRLEAQKEYNTFDLMSTGYGSTGGNFSAFLSQNGEPLSKMCPSGGTCTLKEYNKGKENAYCEIACSVHDAATGPVALTISPSMSNDALWKAAQTLSDAAESMLATYLTQYEFTKVSGDISNATRTFKGFLKTGGPSVTLEVGKELYVNLVSISGYSDVKVYLEKDATGTVRNPPVVSFVAIKTEDRWVKYVPETGTTRAGYQIGTQNDDGPIKLAPDQSKMTWLTD